MNTLSVSTEQMLTSIKIQCTDNIYEESDKTQTETVSYEHEGYQIRVHFNGNKTLKQCIQNIAKRKFGCGSSSFSKAR